MLTTSPRSNVVSRAPRRFAVSLLLHLAAFLMPASALALAGRVLLPDGTPASGSQISIQGTPGSVRADAGGRFSIDPRSEPPFLIVVVGPRGEIYTSVVAERHADALEIQLEPALRESVTVTSGVAPNIEAPPAAATSVIGREDLEERGPEHLADTLVRTAGVQIRGEGAPAVPILRGLGGGRTLILVDDARVTAERRAGPSATFLDPFALASVEVARGPGSVAYGSEALGGVIHARPRDPVAGAQGLRYESSASFEGRPLRSAGLEYTRDAGSGALLALVHARRGEDGEAGNGARIPNSAFADHGASVRFALPARRGFFRASLTLDRAHDVGAPAADATVTRAYYPTEESRRLTLSWDATPSRAFTTVEIRAALGSYDITTNRERLPNATTTRQIASAVVTANDLLLRAAATRATGRARLQAGLDLNSRFNLHATGMTESFDAGDTPLGRVTELSVENARKRDLGLFAICDWSVATNWALSAGARVDRIDTANRGGFFGDRSRDDTALSGQTALTWAPLPALSIALQAASGYRDPTLSDRYFRGVSGRGFVVGNPDLRPERSLQFDTAVRWERARHSLALLAYHYRIRNLVERFRNGADYNFRNRGVAEVRGLEIEAAMPLRRRFSVLANASVARGAALSDGAPLDDIAAPNAHLALHWAGTRASAFIHGFFFARDNRPGPVEVARPGYATMDLGVGWRISQQAEIRLHGRNVTDRAYAGSADANASFAPGRSVAVSVNGRL